MGKHSFEVALQNLESAVNKLEGGSLTLEEALTSFEEGIRWSRECHQFLDKAEKRIEIILKDDKGQMNQASFQLED